MATERVLWTGGMFTHPHPTTYRPKTGKVSKQSDQVQAWLKGDTKSPWEYTLVLDGGEVINAQSEPSLDSLNTREQKWNLINSLGWSDDIFSYHRIKIDVPNDLIEVTLVEASKFVEAEVDLA